MSAEIFNWFTIASENELICNRWCTANELFNYFSLHTSPNTNKDTTYQSFLKQLNLVQKNNNNVSKKVDRNYGQIRIYKYYIFNTRYPTRHKQSVSQSTRSRDNTRHTNYNISSPPSISDRPSISITPIDIRPNDDNSTTSRKSKMSMQYNRPLEQGSTLSIPVLDTVTNNHETTCIHLYPTLNKYGIQTDLSIPANKSVVQSLLRDIDKLNRSFDLSFPRVNNNIVKPFFIPSSLSSQRSFNAWDTGIKGVSGMLSYMSNGNLNPSTGDPIAIEYMLRKLLLTYPKSFNNQANSMGYDIPTRMNVVETAAVLSEVGVGDKKILNTLQKHIKAKYNGREIFCPKKDLCTLTERIPTIKCNETLIERELGIKKENVGLSYIDSIEAITFDMDRVLQLKFKSKNIFDPSLSNSPLFSTITPSQQDGTYVLIGTDHGQGTAQFMIRILLGNSSCRRTKKRPDYNTRDINYATIRCRKDPYEILKLTMEETNKCIQHLNNHKMIALSDDTSLVRCIFVEKKYVTFRIDNNTLIASGPGIEESYPVPPDLNGPIKHRIIFNSFHVLQVGDLLAQMTLQGREGMASCRCIKCNLTQKEWKSGLGYTLLNITDLKHTNPNTHIGQRRPMLWEICPTNTVVPILHCELGTVNDQLFKKLFRQILSLEVGSSDELEKRSIMLDHKESLELLKDTKEHMELDLLMITYQITQKRVDLVKKRISLKGRIKNYKRKRNNTCSIHLSSMESLYGSIVNEIQELDQQLLSAKENIISIEKEIASETKLLQKVHSEVKVMQWNRRTKEVSIHTKVERIFEKHGVKIQAYHGGTLTGGAILMLLKKHQVIMDDVSKVCHEYLLSTDTSSQTMTVEALEVMLDEHRTLFQAQDAVYAHLRLIDPTVDEMQETRERIAIMKILWLKMNLSETPKAHLIFSHAADDQERFGGLGDKIEDPLEKRHQEQLRVNAILNKMTGGYKKQRQLQFKYEWRNSNPLVKDRIEVVQSLTNRKRKLDQVSLGVERQNVQTNERHKLRVSNINDIKLTQM